MSDKRSLVKIVKERFETGNYDFQSYYEIVDGLISKTYDKMTAGNNISEIVSQNTFHNQCWDKLEEGGLIKQLYYKEFGSDAKMAAFIKKSFENLLLEMLDKANPGFRSRKKQVQRVLKPLCLEEQMTELKLWKLKSFEGQSTEPASFEHLMASADSIPLPEVRYPKSENTDKGPSIRDKDMETYMVRVLENAGGSTTYKEMNAFINSQFRAGYVSKMEIPPGTENGETNQEEQMERMIHDESEVMAGSYHYMAAEKIFRNMPEEFRDLMYHRFIKEMKQSDFAKLTGKSTGAISEMEKSVREHIANHLIDDKKQDNEGFSIEESRIILQLMSNLIIQSRHTV